MPGTYMPGIDITYQLAEDVSRPYSKAFIYDELEGEVALGVDGASKFAGILTAVTISRSTQAPYVTQAYAGDNVTLKKYGITEAIADGDIAYGDAVGLGDDGKLKTLADYDVSGTATQVIQQVGRAQEDAKSGERFLVNLGER